MSRCPQEVRGPSHQGDREPAFQRCVLPAGHVGGCYLNVPATLTRSTTTVTLPPSIALGPVGTLAQLRLVCKQHPSAGVDLHVYPQSPHVAAFCRECRVAVAEFAVAS